jgi:Tfp pilus assembly protein PilV
VNTLRKGFRRAAGFTLVEALVAIAVLGLIVALMANLANLTVMTVISSRKHLDADSQARLVFDRMASDFGKMVKRTDIDYLFYKNAAGSSGVNDSMFFYAESPSYANVSANNSTAALVGYRINSTTLQLERLGEDLTWDTATTNDASSTASNTKPGTVVFLAWSGGATPATSSLIDGVWTHTVGTMGNNYTDGTDPDFHVLGDLTYRLEISFLLTDGTISTKPVLSATPSTWGTGPQFFTSSATTPGLTNDGNSSNSPYYTVGSRWYDTANSRGYICTSAQTGAAQWSPIGTQDISAVIVAIAILDANTRKTVTSTSQLVGALPDSVDGTPISQTWDSSSYLSSSGLPRLAASQIRIYQRYFYLNNQ